MAAPATKRCSRRLAAPAVAQPPRDRTRYCLAGPAWRAGGPACPNRDASWVRMGQVLGPRGPTGSAELDQVGQLVGSGEPTRLARAGQLLGPGGPSPGPRLANYLARIGQLVGPAGPRTWPGRPQERGRRGQGLGPNWDKCIGGTWPTCEPTLALVTTVTPVSTTTSPSYAKINQDVHDLTVLVRGAGRASMPPAAYHPHLAPAPTSASRGSAADGARAAASGRASD